MRRVTQTSVAAGWVTTLVAGACAALLAGCGQKGPLTLPATAAAPVAAAASAPAPAR